FKGGESEKGQILRSGLYKVGAAGRNRTHDPLVRSQVLYPAELQPPETSIIAALSGLAKSGRAHSGSAIRIPKWKRPDLAIWPFEFWCGWQESNPRPLGS